MKRFKIGLAFSGSYCTFDKALDAVARLCEVYDVTPVLSESAVATDSRFGLAADFRNKLKELTGKEPITSIPEAEPIGPGNLLDVMVVAPCTGNTLAKLASGITDSSVTMAVKAHLRNEKPIVLAISTNDGLSGNAQNIGALLNRRHIYFVPFAQDDPINKPRSLVANLSRLEDTIEAALQGRQLQPILEVV